MGGELFTREIAQQVHAALENADLALFILDGASGVTPQDEDLCTSLKKSGIFKRIPVIGVVNKVDVDSHEARIADFYSMGLDSMVTLSAEHGRGVDELKILMSEELLSRTTQTGIQPGVAFPEASQSSDESSEFEETSENLETEEESEEETEKFEKKIPRIAIVGRPNVGKSTLLNAVLGENRVITSPIAGTTVDSVDTFITQNGQNYCLIDTAGIRRKGKTNQGVEVLSVVQAKKALEQADIAILVLDGEEGTSDQDEKIGGLIEEAGCSVILLLNKWDTQRSNPKFTKELAAERIRKKIAFLRYAPIIFASAIRNQGLDDLWDLIEEILHQRKLKIPTHEFTEWVRKESNIHNPMNARFYLCHQSGRNPPTFVCHVSDPERVHFSLKRHLVNALRERWGYMGSPVRMLFVEGSGKKLSPRK